MNYRYKIEEYNQHDRLIYSCQDFDGNEYLTEYDDHGNIIHIKNSNGHEKWYDSNGHLIHVRYSNGHEEWWDHDDHGKLIHKKYFDGF